MAGVQDAWGFTKGHTKTTVNYSIAALEALRATSQMRVTDEQRERLKIVSGPVKMHMAPSIVVEESVETEKEAKAEEATKVEAPKEAAPAADATVKKEEA